ncbi:MAG TPA: class I SAM-dependent methyltransferase [Tepidisphaeraceae bacterium]|jgi:SAM-dependent methyltransferase
MVKQKIGRVVRLTEDRVRQLLKLNESEQKLASQSQRFWTRPMDQNNSLWWHARDSTIFNEAEQNWQAMGQRHTAMFADFARAAGIERPVQRIVDWGCGGGANAVAFAPECREMWCVDVADAALAECGRQLAALRDPCGFHPVSITVPDPEAALGLIPNHAIDLFVCFYVFELLPSPEHGARVLRIAHKLLRPGGACIIQIKYQTESWKTRTRRWGYTRSAANMTSYRVESFWELAESCGFQAKTVTLVPKPSEVPDQRYAYFMLQKPAADL